jgi:hypothetical protein
MLRDFKKNAGMPVERWLETLRQLECVLEGRNRSALIRLNPPVDHLTSYYQHMLDLARGYEQDPEKLKEHLRIIHEWHDEANQLKQSLSTLTGAECSGIRRRLRHRGGIDGHRRTGSGKLADSGVGAPARW